MPRNATLFVSIDPITSDIKRQNLVFFLFIYSKKTLVPTFEVISN